MAIKIYNSLTRKKQELTIGKGKTVGMYVCGPTVYDESHIGHARSAYIFDFIVKYMRYRGLKIKFVRNVTDIDDKIIDRARREPGDNLKDKAKTVAEKYLASYHEDMALLGLARPDIEPKATETIPDMISFIKILIKKEFAYAVAGSVYFNVRRFKDYGKLSGQGPDEMEEGARVSPDKNKKDPLDFALWKASKEDEPSWDSPWGKGRPGWHIECSVMSTKFLGSDFLIHGGGLDLIFPHHENEVAQTVCAGRKSADYWIHNGLLTINGQKMSKSVGNFITIKDFYEKNKDLDLLKLLFLTTHYRHPVDYTEGKIEDVKNAKERISTFSKKTAEMNSTGSDTGKASFDAEAKLKSLERKFHETMDDDFNAPGGLAAIFELVALGNACLAKHDIVSANTILKVLLELCAIFGISIDKAEEALNEEEKRLLDERDEARRAKDFKKSDELRDLLLKRGVSLEDTKDGTVWRKRS